MDESPEELAEHGCLQNSARHRPVGRMSRLRQTHEVAKTSGVREVNLRCLHKPLSNVREVWTHRYDLEARLENRKPCFDSVECDAQIPGDIGETEKLGTPCGKHSDKALELREVADLTKGSHVAFEVGLHVGPVPLGNVPSPTANELRIPPDEKRFPV